MATKNPYGHLSISDVTGIPLAEREFLVIDFRMTHAQWGKGQILFVSRFRKRVRKPGWERFEGRGSKKKDWKKV